VIEVSAKTNNGVEEGKNNSNMNELKANKHELQTNKQT